MLEVRITGTFITGVTLENKEIAEQEVKKLLEKSLFEAGLLLDSDLFKFQLIDIESKPL